MSSGEWVPEGIDTERPSSARIYDYFLGGAHNFAADREVAEQTIAVLPNTLHGAQANRAFLRRAVEFLVDAGVRQFLDIGSGIPTVGHVHEIAQARAPESRVVFVDIDPVAVAHSRLMLEANDLTGVVQEDVRRPEQILAAPEVQRLINFDQPVAVIVVALFHFIADSDDPAGLITRLTEPLIPSSHVVISHATDDGPADLSEAKDTYHRAAIDVTLRSRDQVGALLSGLDLVEPGVVWVPRWRAESPDDVLFNAPESSGMYAGVGRKR